MSHPASADHPESGSVQAAARHTVLDRPALADVRTTTNTGRTHAGALRLAVHPGNWSITNAAIATAPAGSAVDASNWWTHARRRRGVSAADAIRPHRFRADSGSA